MRESIMGEPGSSEKLLAEDTVVEPTEFRRQDFDQPAGAPRIRVVVLPVEALCMELRRRPVGKPDTMGASSVRPRHDDSLDEGDRVRFLGGGDRCCFLGLLFLFDLPPTRLATISIRLALFIFMVE